MQLSFSDLRTKEVVNTTDGKKLGKVCDIVFCYPENRVLGIVVPGGKGFGFRRGEVFIDMKCIVKLGEDVVLVSLPACEKKQKCEQKPSREEKPPRPQTGFFPNAEPYAGRRSYEEYE